MSIFSTIFSPIEKWRENPERKDSLPQSCSQEITNIDKIERVEAKGIEGISINAKTNIIISTSKESEIIIKIHGIKTANYELNAYVTQIDKIIHINARRNTDSTKKKEKTSVEKKGEGVSDHTFANITLEVIIPEKSEINRIKIKNSSGNIICKQSINVDVIDIISKNGDIQIGSTFKTLLVSSRQGGVSVVTTAISDLHVEIDNNEGTVNLNFNNIGHIYMRYQLDGACIINPKYGGEFAIYGKINVSKGSLVFS